MIFRRIKTHVEKENWFAVGIDFCIVVIGVFIGIQVANWNEARVDQKREALILERLEADFHQIEAASLEAIYETDYSISVIESLILESEEPLRVFSAGLSAEELEAITFFKGPLRGSSTYDELKSAGQLRFIRSESLRSELTDFERTRVTHTSANDGIHESRFRTAPTIASVLDILYSANTSDNTKVKDTLLESTELKLTAGQKTRELGGLLSHYLTVKYWHEITLIDTRQVLAELEDRGSEKR